MADLNLTASCEARATSHLRPLFYFHSLFARWPEDQGALTTHFFVHHPHKSQCPLCSNNYQRRNELVEHVAGAHGPNKFMCPVDGCSARSMVMRSSIARHIKKYAEQCELHETCLNRLKSEDGNLPSSKINASRPDILKLANQLCDGEITGDQFTSAALGTASNGLSRPVSQRQPIACPCSQASTISTASKPMMLATPTVPSMVQPMSSSRLPESELRFSVNVEGRMFDIVARDTTSIRANAQIHPTASIVRITRDMIIRHMNARKDS